jgi:zinc/manganese transport system permease protein
MFSGFMVNTWVVASLVALVAGIVGFFVVLRGSSFAAHALPLCSFPGAAAATLLGVNEFLGLVVFAALGVLGISQLSRRGRQEVATALSLLMLLGLGDLFLSMTQEYAQNNYAMLFGQVLGVSDGQVIAVASMSLVTIASVIVMFRRLLLSSVSPALAEARGISSRRMELWFLVVLAFATSMALPVVGALLVFSLMVGPAAAARALTNRPVVAMLLSVGISLLTVWASIALSYTTNWPVGFFVGTIGALSYGLGRVWGGLSWRPGWGQSLADAGMSQGM